VLFLPHSVYTSVCSGYIQIVYTHSSNYDHIMVRWFILSSTQAVESVAIFGLLTYTLTFSITSKVIIRQYDWKKCYILYTGFMILWHYIMLLKIYIVQCCTMMFVWFVFVHVILNKLSLFLFVSVAWFCWML